MKLLNPWELLIVVFVVILIFGPKRIPQMGRSIGGGIREFKDSITHRVDKQDAEAEAEATNPAPAQLPPAPAVESRPQVDQREHDTVV